VSSASAA
jgi:hypothetical protein